MNFKIDKDDIAIDVAIYHVSLGDGFTNDEQMMYILHYNVTDMSHPENETFWMTDMTYDEVTAGRQTAEERYSFDGLEFDGHEQGLYFICRRV